MSAKYTIVAFGDSLTEGWYDGGYKFHPYTLKLAKLFETEFPGVFEFCNEGVSGETTSEMEMRLPKVLSKITASGLIVSHVIILGGTNDLATEEPHVIIDNLEKLYKIVHSEKANVIAMTVPDAFFKDIPYVAKRKAVNDWIKSQKNFPVIDLETRIPYPEKKRSEYWDDYLHFSQLGYDKIAEILLEETKEYFREFVSKKVDDKCLVH